MDWIKSSDKALCTGRKESGQSLTKRTMFPTGSAHKVPNPFPPKSTQKPRQAAWDDPNVIWPPVIPAPTRLTGKALLKQIEKEEHSRLKNLKTFQFPTFKAGDVVKYFNLDSIISTRYQREKETSSLVFASVFAVKTLCMVRFQFFWGLLASAHSSQWKWIHRSWQNSLFISEDPKIWKFFN